MLFSFVLTLLLFSYHLIIDLFVLLISFPDKVSQWV